MSYGGFLTGNVQESSRISISELFSPKVLAPAGIKSGLFSLDSETIVIAVFDSAEISETAPAAPTSGDLWLDSTTAELFIYNENAWVVIGS